MFLAFLETQTMIPMEFGTQLMIVLEPTTIVGYAMGQGFPRAIAAARKRLTPWEIAVGIVSSTQMGMEFVISTMALAQLTLLSIKAIITPRWK